jgi:hypothetical protein
MMENTEDELEKYLKDSFDDFEVEPSETFWENLEPSLPAPERDWRRPLYALLLLLLISSISWVWFGKSDNKTIIESTNSASNNHIARQNQDVNKADDIDETQQQATLANSHENKQIKAKTLENEAKYNENTPIDEDKTFTKKRAEITSGTTKTKEDKQVELRTQKNISVTTDGIVIKKQIAPNTELQEENIVTKNRQNVVGKETNKNIAPEKNNLNNAFTQNQSAEKSLKENLTYKSATNAATNGQEILSPDNKNISNTDRFGSNIGLLNYKNVAPLTAFFMLPQPRFVVSSKPKITKLKLPLQWQIGTEISNTYQNIKVVNFSEVSLLDVNAPAIFASQRRSMQFSVGVIKPTSPNANIRASASLITLKQWTDYDTFSGVYKATNLGQNKYEITQVNNNYSETQTLKYLSLGINRQVFITKTPAFRFFVSGGAEGLIPLGGQSAQYGFSASVGLQQKINEKLCFTLEPKVMYLLNKNTYDSNHLMQISPYTIGLKGSLVLIR